MIQCYNTQMEREKMLKSKKKYRLCKTCRGKGCKDCDMKGYYYA